MGEGMGFFCAELRSYFEQRGKSVSAKVLRILDTKEDELAGEDLAACERLVLPARGAILHALRRRLEGPFARREEWEEGLRKEDGSVIARIAAQVLAKDAEAPSADTCMLTPPEGKIEAGAEGRAAPLAAASPPPQEAAGGRALAADPAAPRGAHANPSPLPAHAARPDAGGATEARAAPRRGMRPVKAALSALFWACFAALCLFLALLALSVFDLGIRAFAVSSGSMSPAIRAGDLVFVRASRAYRAGDVITYQPEGAACTTHRISEVVEEEGETLYVTRGDANERADDRRVRPAEVVGKVVLTLPRLGHAVSFLRSPPGFVLVMSAFAVIIAALLWDIAAELLSRRKGHEKARPPSG